MEVASRMVEIEPSITRLIVKLEKRGLVERQRDQTDGRSFLCKLTTDGSEVLDHLDEPFAQFEEDYLRCLNDDELRTLSGVLADICAIKA